MGFILCYNLIIPHFVRQHYKAVQLKPTTSPTTWFPEKASAMVPLCVKDVFTAENSEHGGKIHNPHVLSAWVQQRYKGKVSSPH